MDRAAASPAPAIAGDDAGRGRAARPTCGAPPYRPRRPQVSPLYRVLSDHFDTLERVHEERFEPTHGPLRSSARRAVGRFLDCGLLEHGLARVRCGTCRAEFLVAFRCKGRHFCPSCHARRLAEWGVWLDEHLLAPVAHRQVVLTLPKRLRPYFVPDRRRLGLLSQVATRTLRAYVQAALGEREAVPGLVVCVQTFGSVAHFHPHLHVLMSDGGFRRDGTFVRLPEPEAAVLEALWQRTVLAEFVRRGWFETDEAAAMLAWRHSGFGAYVGPRIEEREGLLRVARYSARAPVAESRLRYDAERAQVELVSDRVDGPYAGVQRMTALEFIARWVDHVPERYEVRVRYAGAYATRRRVWWGQRGVSLARSRAAPAEAPEADHAWPALRERRRRWAELLRLMFRVEVEVCPRCGGEARILGFVTEPAVVRRILAHLERGGVDARAGPWAAAPG
jgi:hypothetical protein